MRQAIIARLKNDNFYWYGSEINDQTLALIAAIFLDGTDVNYFIEWLKDIANDYTSGNSVYFLKNEVDKNNVYIGFSGSSQPNETEVDRANLLEILEKWKDYKANGADEIILTNNNGTIDISANYFDRT